jgi:hypothetical protein
VPVWLIVVGVALVGLIALAWLDQARSPVVARAQKLTGGQFVLARFQDNTAEILVLNPTLLSSRAAAPRGNCVMAYAETTSSRPPSFRFSQYGNCLEGVLVLTTPLPVRTVVAQLLRTMRRQSRSVP